MPPDAGMPWSSPPRSTLVGRALEHSLLRARFEAARSGHGSLVLVNGKAGMGKTTLVRAVADDIAAHGDLVLSGTCYDSTPTPPFGPWRELIGGAARRHELPSVPPILLDDEWLSTAPSPNAFVSALRDTIDALAQRGPIVLMLEDLHWADPESLEFLRIYARQIRDMSILLIATYRDEDLAPGSDLSQVLPQLVRESDAHRIGLRRLDDAAIEALVTQRYGLADPDRARLTAHVKSRSQGVPLYALELLRSLEQDQRLRFTPGGWVLADIDRVQVPVLIKQVIDGRMARFSPEVRRLLEPAAVIGQDVPILLWRRISGADDDVFGMAIEQATTAHILEEDGSELHLQFTHALVRDALYEAMPLPRRQMWHRRIAETLAQQPGSEPDSVAHHFRQALDPRAIEWFIRAGNRVERVARMSAARAFEMALEMMSGSEVDPAERGWLLMRRARLLRAAEPSTALAALEAAEALAIEAGDRLLMAYVTFFRGQTRCLSGEIRSGMADLESSVIMLDHLSPGDLVRLEELERQDVVLSRAEAIGLRAALLATIGRIDDALRLSGSIIEHAEDPPPVRAWWARAIATALAGRPLEAAHAFKMCRDALSRSLDETPAAIMLIYQLSTAQIPYGADDLAERRRIAGDGEAAWLRSGGALGDVSHRIASLPLLLIEGDWLEARELAVDGRLSSDATSQKHLLSTMVLAQLARIQADTPLAWELIRELLPGGPKAVPGTIDLAPAMTLMRLAASLCLDEADIPAAQAWLATHDRWLAWSGAVLGQADGQVLQARYFQTARDLARARHHARCALELAADPRQPLVLLAAHRTLGEIETSSGQLAEARAHLDAALKLADSCAAPYERALTRLAVAELKLCSGAIESADASLNQARDTFNALGAVLALARSDTVAARLSELRAAVTRTNTADLSPRELDVLRLVATGRSNREIAEAFFLSVRTVERHITNLYAKIDTKSRAEAISYAHAHDLI